MVQSNAAPSHRTENEELSRKWGSLSGTFWEAPAPFLRHLRRRLRIERHFVSKINLRRRWKVSCLTWEVACSMLSDSGEDAKEKVTPLLSPVSFRFFSCLCFLNSVDPTISEPGTAYLGSGCKDTIITVSEQIDKSLAISIIVIKGVNSGKLLKSHYAFCSLISLIWKKFLAK